MTEMSQQEKTKTTTPYTLVSRLIAKRNANTDLVWVTEDGFYD